MYSETILLFSPIWWKYFSAFMLVISTVLYLTLWLDEKINKIISKILGLFLIVDTFFLPYYIYLEGYWTISYSLPLQFCNIMGLIAGIALLTKNQKLYEISLFMGIAAPFQAILTPGFAHGAHGCYLYEFYLSHGATIFAPIFLTLILNLRPRKKSWWQSLITFSSLLPFVYLFNYLVGGNYMFLMAPPPVSNPLIIGAWPWYLLLWVGYFVVFSFLTSKVIKPTKD